MTPSPPDEALHFRGKTLTPESPRPLHIPEPANIPVLENQMDPIFNDTSTYERSEWPEQPGQDAWTKDGQGRLDGGLQQQQQKNTVMNDNPADIYPPHSTGTEHGQGANVNPGLALPDATHSHAPPLVPVSQGVATTSEIENAVKVEPPRVDDDAEDAGPNTGVNFQTLLDNLSSGAATAAASHLEGSSLHQASSEESPQSLPARPLDPSFSTNYASNSYEQPPPAPPASSAYAAQPSNNAQHFPPSMASGGAPGTDAGIGSLPPPPPASFQHTTSSGATLQASQAAPKKGRPDKQPVRSGKGTDDDSPWGPEVQKKYDEFLHDERIYVTEGLWDRFPMGSRLFVGQFHRLDSLILGPFN
jgi:hypothetical protein